MKVKTNKKITLSTILSTNFAEINKTNCCAIVILTESKLIKS